MLIKLLLLQIVTFAGIVFLLRFLFLRHLKSALTRLNTLHEENLAKEEELNQELKRAKEQGEAMIQQSKEDAESVLAEAAGEAHGIRLKAEEDARLRAEKIIEGSRVDCEKIKECALKDIQAQSIELALKIISDLLTEADKIALQYELANGIIEEISHLPRAQFNIQGGEVNVISSFPLLERQCSEIKRILSEKAGVKVELNQRIDPGIIGGLIVEMSGTVIDGTLKNKLQRIISHIR